MTDIVTRLNELIGSPFDQIAQDAIAEIMALRTRIEQLRGIVGVATGDGPSFAEIKRDIGK